MLFLLLDKPRAYITIDMLFIFLDKSLAYTCRTYILNLFYTPIMTKLDYIIMDQY